MVPEGLEEAEGGLAVLSEGVASGSRFDPEPGTLESHAGRT